LKKTLYIPFLIAALLIGQSCSQEKNTLVNRTFHNLTAHYNGYFWARENIKEGVDKIQRSTPDDFGKLIPLFVYGDEKTVKSNISYFDKAIEKESRVIKFHSMLIKGKEYCKWIDENYLVMGQAHFYKKDYFAAIEVFEYIVRQYPNSQTRYQALMWLIRTYNAQLSVINTQATIDLLENDKNFPKKFAGEFASLQAEYYLMMENYEKAEQQLRKAIPLTKAKKQKARFLYVLAQIEEMKGNTKLAAQYYKQCAELHPPYDMYFNSKIKRAMTVSSGSDAASVRKELRKMLKDEKNLEFRDQIYYALAEMDIKDKDTTSALKKLRLSTYTSAQNTRQRGMSFLREADIYFQRTEYKTAQAYYDSAVSFLPKDFKDYEVIVNKKNSLTGLVKNINIISREDSLLAVGAMDSVKRNALIKKIIDDVIAEEKRKEQEKQDQNDPNSPNFVSPNTNNNTFGNNNAPGAWYYYNPGSISSGFSDFAKKWGARQLEDNWRRSNKEVVVPQENEPVTNIKDTTGKKNTVADNHKPEYYLKNVPIRPEDREISKGKIIEAYNNLGGIYKEQLHNYDRSIESFEALNRLYPGNKYEVQAYYQLYRLYLLKNNKQKADYYAKIITTKYPDTEFAQIILHPEKVQESIANRNKAEQFYNETYNTYVNGKYTDALAMTNQADSLYGTTDLMPKFALLKAYCIGRTQTITEYQHALEKIIIKYPKDPAKQKAQDLLDQLKRFRSSSDTTKMSKTDTIRQLFTPDLAGEHYVMIILPNKKLNANEFKVRLSTFNGEYFSLANLSIFSSLLGMDYQVFTIRSFENSVKAMDYYQLIVSDQKVFKDIDPKAASVTVITPDNYGTLIREKKREEYLKFFRENYLRK
jgi:tetratricopeptide (TPR) repeat protein